MLVGKVFRFISKFFFIFALMKDTFDLSSMHDKPVKEAIKELFSRIKDKYGIGKAGRVTINLEHVEASARIFGNLQRLGDNEESAIIKLDKLLQEAADANEAIAAQATIRQDE